MTYVRVRIGKVIHMQSYTYPVVANHVNFQIRTLISDKVKNNLKLPNRLSNVLRVQLMIDIM